MSKVNGLNYSRVIWEKKSLLRILISTFRPPIKSEWSLLIFEVYMYKVKGQMVSKSKQRKLSQGVFAWKNKLGTLVSSKNQIKPIVVSHLWKNNLSHIILWTLCLTNTVIVPFGLTVKLLFGRQSNT